MFWALVCVSVLGWRCRLLFLLYSCLLLLLLLPDPVLQLVILGLLELVLSLVVGVILGVQLTVYGTLQKKRSR